MSGSRDAVLSRIRAALGNDAPGGHAAVSERLARPARNLVPARGRLPSSERIEQFVRMAREAYATVAGIPVADDLPAAVAGFLRGHGAPLEIAIAPDESLRALPWAAAGLSVRAGAARDGDATSVTACVAAVAETGTLVLASGPSHPSTLNLLPDNHVVLVRKSQVVGCYEDAWDLVRARGSLPRTVLWVTGASRTADIEQTMQLGAHGPRRLHIVLTED